MHERDDGGHRADKAAAVGDLMTAIRRHLELNGPELTVLICEDEIASYDGPEDPDLPSACPNTTIN